MYYFWAGNAINTGSVVSQVESLDRNDLSRWNQSILKNEFRNNPFLTKESQQILINKTGLNKEILKAWFMNQRSRLVKKWAHISWQGMLLIR